MAPTTPISTVFFDVGGTLLDELDPIAWSDAATVVGLELDPDHLAHAFVDVDRSFDGPDPSPPFEEFWRRVLETAAERPVDRNAVARFLDSMNGRTTVRLYSDAKGCLEKLRADGLRLAVISNSRSEEHLRERLAEVGVARYFEALVSSGTEGVAKPDAAIFRRAAERLGIAPSAALHVGDQAWRDARAATRAGLHGLWLRRDGTGLGDDPPEITSLSELPGYVRGLRGAPVK